MSAMSADKKHPAEGCSSLPLLERRDKCRTAQPFCSVQLMFGSWLFLLYYLRLPHCEDRGRLALMSVTIRKGRIEAEKKLPALPALRFQRLTKVGFSPRRKGRDTSSR